MVTCPSEVCFDGGAAVLAGDDVFAMESEKRILILMCPAVFATVAGSVADEIAKSGVQADSLCCRGVREDHSGLGLQNCDHVCSCDQRFVLVALVRGEPPVIGEFGQIIDLRLRIGVGTEGHEPTGSLG